MDEIVSLILSPRWKSLSFFSVVLKKKKLWECIWESRVQSWNLTGRLVVWRAARCLVSICQMIVCVRLARQEMREEKVKQEMETRKKKKKRWPPTKSSCDCGCFHTSLLPFSHPFVHRKIKRKEERQQWRWRESKVFFFSFKEGGPAPLKPWAWQVQSHRLLSLTASHTPPPHSLSLSLALDVLGSGNATRWKKKRKSLYHPHDGPTTC